jgi:spermidine synthase
MRARPGMLFALFALSGFTGLVYESVWSHYLKLFLGAAAFAQTFVLAAFMGGMALGAWLASRASARWTNLLAAYAWTEGLVGLAALAFHPVFVWATDASLDHVFPALGTPAAIETYKYALCAALIVPQTMLLGMTFPLMSGAVLRRYPLDAAGRSASGHHLAMLYFTNSGGAALGALVAAFWLLGWLGMPGSLRFAGALNLALAAVVLALARRAEPGAPPAVPAAGAAPASRKLVAIFLAAAAATGAASFVYEIAWIRMLSLVLGSSFHAFELMLSAFITGLALGGLWIRKRIDRIANPVRFSGYVQLAMGLAALATIFLYHASFDGMAWVLDALRRTDSGYVLYNLFNHGIAFAVMLPATFFAGMTLPLFTHVLVRGGHGERAIGQVYAANTLGAIAGVLLAAHLLVPTAGLKITLIVGAALDVVVGAWLLRWSGVRLQRTEAFAALILGLLAASITARAAALEPARLASGVFRYGKVNHDDEHVIYYRDGKTASVAVLAQGSARVISTNGKPDAAIQMDPSLPRAHDEYTMTLLGALPLLAHPGPVRVANIGLGSGLTAETLLSHSATRVVDTIEIEPAMATGALAFFPRVDRAFRDRRMHVYFEDAKSYFARHGRRYDVIVSEPSNPWVNGVASLFTAEFYRHTVRYLEPGGLFVQWLHTYEINDRLLGSMFAALDAVFADYDVYQANEGDLIVLAVPEGRAPRPAALPADQPGFLDMLRAVHLTRLDQILAHRIGSRRELAPLLAQFDPEPNSDYRPVVQLEAPRSRFLRESADAIVELALAPLPVLEMLGNRRHEHLSAPAPRTSPGLYLQQVASLEVERALVAPHPADEPVPPPQVLALRQPGALCAPHPAAFTLEQLHVVALNTLSHLGPRFRRELWVEPRWLGCPLERASTEVRERFSIYAAVAERDPRAMLERARALLGRSAAAPPAWQRYLLLVAVLGAQAGGQGDEARRLWAGHPDVLKIADIAPFERYLADWKN